MKSIVKAGGPEGLRLLEETLDTKAVSRRAVRLGACFFVALLALCGLVAMYSLVKKGFGYVNRQGQIRANRAKFMSTIEGFDQDQIRAQIFQSRSDQHIFVSHPPQSYGVAIGAAGPQGAHPWQSLPTGVSTSMTEA